MAKQRIDNLELILLDDHDEDSFYADYVENLNKINTANKAKTEARTEGDAATLAAALAYFSMCNYRASRWILDHSAARYCLCSRITVGKGSSRIRVVN